jgi:tetratricopeptide (TPR) repeat protein
VNALISGIAARAVFIEGATVTYVDLDSPDDFIAVHHADIGNILADASDVVEIQSTDRDEVLCKLEELWSKDRALRMLQLALDDDEELIPEAVEFLDDLLQKDTADWVLNLALSWPLPGTPRLDIITPCKRKYASAWECIEKVADLQESIAHVRTAWEEIDLGMFHNSLQRVQMESVAVTDGLFRKFVEAHAGRTNWNEAALASYMKLQSYKNSRAIVQAWEHNIGLQRTKSIIEYVTLDLSEEEDFIDKEEQAVPVGAWEAYQRVKRAQEGIIDRLKRGEVSTAKKFAVNLVQEQLAEGNAQHASKTLCSLAQEAKKRGYTSLQLEWVQHATIIAPDDAWAFAQTGDVLLNLYRLAEADSYFAQAAQKGDKHYGSIGHARVLKKSNKLEEALAAFRQAQEDFPDHPEAYRAWAGIGEVFRDMDRPEEALEIYSKAVQLFPNEDVLWCGRAATMKDLGELDRALSAYQEAIIHFPNTIHAWAGTADIYKELGELEIALSRYDDVIARFPTEAIGYCGRADVLREQGNFEDALTVYAKAIDKFGFDPSPYSGRAETLRDWGRLDEALEAYSCAVNRFPYEPYLRNGRANLIKFMGDLQLALQAYDQNVRDFPYSLFALTGRANLLKELGKYQEALNAYDDIVAKRAEYKAARYAKAAVLTIMGRVEEAKALLPEGEPRTKDEWVAYHIRGMIHLRAGELEQALDIFTHGLLRVQFRKQRAYFHTALAAAKLSQNQYKEALNYVKDQDGPVANLLEMHSAAALGQHELAMECYTNLLDDPRENVLVLSEEIARRFGLAKSAPLHSENWILEKEAEIVLALAA